MSLASLIHDLGTNRIGQHTIGCCIIPIGKEMDDCVALYLFPGTLHKTPVGMFAISWIPSLEVFLPINLSYLNRTVGFGTLLAVKPVRAYRDKNSQAIAFVEEHEWMQELVLRSSIQSILNHPLKEIQPLQQYLKETISKVQEGKVLTPIARPFLQMLFDRLIRDDKSFASSAKILRSFLDFQHKLLRPSIFKGNAAYFLIADFKKTLAIQNEKSGKVLEANPEEIEKQQNALKEKLENQNLSLSKMREALFTKTALLFLLTTEKDLASLEEILAVGKRRIPNTALLVEGFDIGIKEGLQSAIDENQITYDTLLRTYSLTRQGWTTTVELMSMENKNESQLKE